ncbi:serine hydrolase domain-containing protein [Cellulophaga omnivescoria]|uniref:serine hydrolase domain-containing protein n=1 Tax=Cellulophaga omnivescoria TaxID=1888890 RepID=UPI0022F1088B|nr:serine hydrolase [Cellulophaga omnivescoria]WBU88972.1 serine hydrolase [Cellulophaga omnivescoria]
MKNLKRVLLVLLVVLIVAVVYNYPKLNMISGYAAKNMASNVYVANRKAQDVNKVDNNVPLIKLANSKIDKSTKSATSSVYGLMPRKAVYRDGLGAVLINDDYDPTKFILQPKRDFTKTGLPFPYGNKDQKDTVFNNVDYTKLSKAIDLGFSNPDIQKTRSTIVIYKDQIIAEQYAGGFTKDTKILGWSMTKSIVSTLYGILQCNGKLNVNQLAPIKEWQNDDRKNITYNHLLRMQSGLEWDENYTEISDATKMLFLEADMTLVQQKKEAIAKPTEIWNYSSGTSNLLSGLLKKNFKSHQEYLDFPYASLIDKIGMHSMLIEADMEGNYVGSSYGWATTRDWAKFGLLYLHKGNWNGERIFDANWVDYVSKPTIHSNGTYGAHFWLNAEGRFPDVPKDMYYASGYQGQYVFVIPSKNLVVVRTGLATYPIFDLNGFLGGITSAIKN